MDTHTRQKDSQTDAVLLADACVACGMCLPSCPTYQQARTETESPRGRISLVKGLLTGQLQPSENLIEHLNACMMCRTCERLCPAQVQFGKIMDEARSYIHDKNLHDLHPQEKIMLSMLEDVSTLKSRFSLLRKIDVLHLRRPAVLLSKSVVPAMAELLEQMPQTRKYEKLKNHYPASREVKDRVMLFTGCVANYVDQATIHAAIGLLNHLGYEVEVPETQQCCGAAHQHAGLHEQAKMLMDRNRQAFGEDERVKVIGLATGCTAYLQDQSDLSEENDFPARVVDICDFLSQEPSLAEIKFANLPHKVLLHIPCSQRNVLRQENSVRKLLGLIPGLQLREIPSSISCCGAAGAYMYTHPEKAILQREQVLNELDSQQEEILVSSNIGCALHLMHGLQQINSKTRVTHPVQLLFESLA